MVVSLRAGGIILVRLENHPWKSPCNVLSLPVFPQRCRAWSLACAMALSVDGGRDFQRLGFSGPRVAFTEAQAHLYAARFVDLRGRARV
jgi:hypothetical protein